MQIDHSLILKLEQLAKLELSPEEREHLTGDLNNILAMIEKLDELDTSHVEPLVYINEEVNVLREDIVKNQVSRKQALSNAPAQNGEYFKVPRVL
jgi:aspartyl-tRNA(Asn)/glutamyl-tRNA(Gln) amidotransferase subunit C